MKEFIEKLIGRLEELKKEAYDKWDGGASHKAYSKAIEIVNQLAEEYNNDFCEWKAYIENKKPSSYYYPSCDTDILFPMCDVENFRVCPYCGKKIKVAPYQPKGE